MSNNYINDEIDIYLLTKDREEAELTHSIAHQISLCVNEDSEFTDFVQNKVCELATSLKEQFYNQRNNIKSNANNHPDVIPF